MQQKINDIAVYTIADNNNLKSAEMLYKMWHYWHKNDPIDFHIINEKECKETLDNNIYYKATPYFANQLFKTYNYKLLIKMDCDQFIFGNLSHLWQEDSYDIGVVYNLNRIDYKNYGYVNVWDIPAQQYFNNGLVVIRSHKFIDWWLHLCNSYHFYNYQYREQDLLNIMIHYGDWKIKSLDEGNMWHGLISKGEQSRFIIKDNKLILPKGDDNYPDEDKLIKVFHLAGGNIPNKTNYRIIFNEETIELIDKMLNHK